MLAQRALFIFGDMDGQRTIFAHPMSSYTYQRLPKIEAFRDLQPVTPLTPETAVYRVVAPFPGNAAWSSISKALGVDCVLVPADEIPGRGEADHTFRMRLMERIAQLLAEQVLDATPALREAG